MKQGSIFFTRHSLRHDPPYGEKLQESASYKGLTEPGVEKSETRVLDIIQMIEDASHDGIIYIGGSSEMVRTKSTAEIYGDAIAKYYQNSNQVVKVFTRSQIDGLRNKLKKDKGSIRKFIQEQIRENPDKKIVFIYPLFLKEFSLNPDFIDPVTKKHTKHTEAIFEKAHGSEDTGAEIFLKNEEIIGGDGIPIKGITPKETVQKQLRGIERLQKFSGKFAGDRHTTIGLVGHAWKLDALAAYLANQGEANLQGWEKTGGKIIDTTEMGKISIGKDEATFTYRGTDYKIAPELLDSKKLKQMI